MLTTNSKIASAKRVGCTDEISVDLADDGLDVGVHQVICDNVNHVTDCEVTTEPVQREYTGNSLTEDSFDQSGETFQFSDGTTFTLPPGLNLTGLGDSDAEEAARLVQRHTNAFSANPLDLGHCDLIPHEIKLTDTKPVNLPYRRVVPSQMTEVKSLLQDLLDRKIIRRSTSSYASPIVLVRKKN